MTPFTQPGNAFADIVYLRICIAVGCIFLLALALFSLVLYLRMRNDQHAARWKQLETRWEGVMLDAIAGDASLQEVWSLVPPKDSLYFIKYLWRFHQTLFGEERKIVAALAAPYLDQLLTRLQGTLPETRARAIVSLTALGGYRYVNQIAKLLDDKSELVSMQAAWSLAQTRDPTYLPLIFANIGRYQSWSHGYLVSLFAAMGESAAPILRDILTDSSRPAKDRALAAWVLKGLNDYAAARIAAALCVSESDPILLTAAISLLGQVGKGEDAKLMYPHCLSQDPKVRTQALHALGQLGGENDWMHFLGSMVDPSAQVRMEAAQALVQAGGSEILRELSLSRDTRAPLARQVLEGIA